MIRVDFAIQEPVAARQPLSDNLPGYRIVHDDETIDLMLELAQYTKNYYTINLTITNNDNTVTAFVDFDPRAIVYRVINLTNKTHVNPPLI